MGLQFNQPSERRETKISFDSYFSGCPKCGSKLYAIQHTYHNKKQELGTSLVQHIHLFESKAIICTKCGWHGTPEHPYYPKGYTVTLGVIIYALNSALGSDNKSAKSIAIALRYQHHVDIDEKTVQDWIDHNQDAFLIAHRCSWESPPSQIPVNANSTISSSSPLGVNASTPPRSNPRYHITCALERSECILRSKGTFKS